MRFRDGEFICGYTLSWSPDREGFFLFPADADSNNQRIYVITGSTLEIKAGPAAEVLAQRVLEEAPARGDAPPSSADARRVVTQSPPPLGQAPTPMGGRRASGFLPRPPRGGLPEHRTGSD